MGTAMSAVPSSPGRQSVVSRLSKRRGASALPIAFTGSVDVIKYNLMHYEAALSLMVTYQIYFAIPSTMLHRASITRRAADTALMSARKQKRLTTTRVLTRYKVYNFRPLAASGDQAESEEAAIKAFAADARVAGRRGRLSPHAAAALVTYTRIYPWTMRHRAPRHGSVTATSHGSPDLAPFVSEHTATRLGLSAAEADLVRSPAFSAASAGSHTGPGMDTFALPPSSAPVDKVRGPGGTPATGVRHQLSRAAQARRSRSVVDFADAPAAEAPGASRDAAAPVGAKRSGPASVSGQPLPPAHLKHGAAPGADSPGPDSPLPPATIGGIASGFGAVRPEPRRSRALPASPLPGSGAQRGTSRVASAPAAGIASTGAS